MPVRRPAASPIRFVTLVLTGTLAACAAEQPTKVHVFLRAARDLNPDEVGLPNPVQTHVYLLRAAETFSNTDYFQLADKERTILGPDLLAVDNQTLRPAETREVTLPVPPDARVLAVTASFRNIDAGTWRASAPVRGTMYVDFGPQTVKIVYTK